MKTNAVDTTNSKSTVEGLIKKPQSLETLLSAQQVYVLISTLKGPRSSSFKW